MPSPVLNAFDIEGGISDSRNEHARSSLLCNNRSGRHKHQVLHEIFPMEDQNLLNRVGGSSEIESSDTIDNVKSKIQGQDTSTDQQGSDFTAKHSGDIPAESLSKTAASDKQGACMEELEPKTYFARSEHDAPIYNQRHDKFGRAINSTVACNGSLSSASASSPWPLVSEMTNQPFQSQLAPSQLTSRSSLEVPDRENSSWNIFLPLETGTSLDEAAHRRSASYSIEISFEMRRFLDVQRNNQPEDVLDLASPPSGFFWQDIHIWPSLFSAHGRSKRRKLNRYIAEHGPSQHRYSGWVMVGDELRSSPNRNIL